MNVNDDFGIVKSNYKINIQNEKDKGKESQKNQKTMKEIKIQNIISRYVPLPSDRSIP